MSNKQSGCMAPLQLAGRLIMENGGETYRVEETITRMGRAFGLQEVESFAIPSGVFVSFRQENGELETAVMRVRKGSTDLTRVDAVNQVSRQVEAGALDCQGALDALKTIEHHRARLSPLQLVLAAAVSSGGWALMFGGGFAEALVAILAAGISQLMNGAFQRRRLHGLVSVLGGSLLAALLPMVVNRAIWPLMVDATVAGALMPMLPGLAMTNAVQDTMRGDIVSGLSHGISALLTAAMVAGGALMAASLLRALTGGGFA